MACWFRKIGWVQFKRSRAFAGWVPHHTRQGGSDVIWVENLSIKAVTRSARTIKAVTRSARTTVAEPGTSHRRPGSPGHPQIRLGAARGPVGAESTRQGREGESSAHTAQTCNPCSTSLRRVARAKRLSCAFLADNRANADVNTALHHGRTCRDSTCRRRVLVRSVKREPQHTQPPKVA